MSSPGEVEELKIKVGLKSSDPCKEYEFLDKLGEGSYGSVLHARHKVTQTEHAIKQVPVEENLHEILRETEHIMECKCENIVGYDDCYLLDSQLWIVMEYCAGGSLADLMKLGRSTLNEDQITVCIRDVLKALAYLHDNNRIHRDIKAGNVLLTNDGTSKLADFGVSGTLSKENSARQTVNGTPFWMAPEVIQETGHNYKADIWSLGITIIELAEGHPPLCNLHPLRAIFVIPSRAPPTFADKSRWSNELNDFLACCLTKEATMRPSAKQLLEHPWLTNRKHLTGDVLKPILEVSELSIKEAGGRDSAMEALYASPSSSPSSSSNTGSSSTSGSFEVKDDGSDGNYGTMEIKSGGAGESDSDESYEADFNTMKVKKPKAKKSKRVDSSDGEEEEYGTMKAIKTKEGANDDGSSSGEYEYLGTIQIKKPIKEKKKTKSKSKDVSTVVVKSSRKKDQNIGTLNRGESPKVKLLRQELEELDVKMVTDLQNVKRQKEKDKETIAAILAARKA